MNYFFLCILLLFSLVACNQSENQAKETPSKVADELQELSLKLDATEAQVYNLRVELSKCKGDSLEIIEETN